VGPPFVRPAADAYPSDWSDPVDPTAFAGACDPLALAILVASLVVPVVIPSGNDGTDAISYPGAPSDFAPVVATLASDQGRPKVREMLAGAGLSIEEALLDRAASALSVGPDPFVDTGIIVVGSATLSDATKRASDLVPARYSQFGPGLCCLCPSDRDEEPWVRPGTQSGQRWNYVPAPDIFGPGGYAVDPSALFSHHGGDYGFGGTSAAAAQTAGIIARVVAASKPADGPSLRRAVVAKLPGPWSEKTGYGIISLGVV
jgi:hypothetical protein